MTSCFSQITVNRNGTIPYTKFLDTFIGSSPAPLFPSCGPAKSTHTPTNNRTEKGGVKEIEMKHQKYVALNTMKDQSNLLLILG